VSNILGETGNNPQYPYVKKALIYFDSVEIQGIIRDHGSCTQFQISAWYA
jgi:hypothetical protein